MYWDKMLVMKNDEEDNDDFIISQKRPSFFAVDKKFKFDIACIEENSIDLNNEKTLNDVSKFYCDNNLTAFGDVMKIKESDILKFTNLSAELVLVKKRKKIYGSILSVLFPVYLETDMKYIDTVEKTDFYRQFVSQENDGKGKRVVFANTTFLNNHKKYRGKGLGMVLIQKSLQIAYNYGILCAYFLNTVPRCKNAVEIKKWVFPVNPDRLDELKVDYPRKYRSGYFIQKKNEIIKLNQNNSESSLKLYLELMKDKKFYMKPDLDYWKRIVENHDVYMVKDEENCIGFFSTHKITCYVPKKKYELENGNIFFCFGKQPETVKSMIYQCRQDGYDFLMLSESGDLNKYILNRIMAINTGKKDYLNFYNTRISLQPSEVYIPLL